MANDGFELTDQARGATSAAWFDYLELVDPFRGDLFRYCRKLTGDVWDAEDLVQDTLEQGFAKLASVHHSVTSPRAYMLRMASNLWIDRTRRRGAEARAVAREARDPTSRASVRPTAGDGLDVRDAGAVLLRDLAPQERAAVLLKDAFDLSLEEIADVLGTTTFGRTTTGVRNRALISSASAGDAAAITSAHIAARATSRRQPSASPSGATETSSSSRSTTSRAFMRAAAAAATGAT